MKSSKYIDIEYCPYCNKETKQEFFNAGHERDSSQDKQTCLECGAYRFGMTGEWDKDTE